MGSIPKRLGLDFRTFLHRRGSRGPRPLRLLLSSPPNIPLKGRDPPPARSPEPRQKPTGSAIRSFSLRGRVTGDRSDPFCVEVMNTGAKPPSGSDPAASRKPTAVKSPLSASASACLLSEGGEIAGSSNSNGNGIGTVHASDRKSQNLAGSSSVSSISTPGTESRPEPAIPRIVYGRGKIHCLPTELARLCVSAPLIVSSPSRIPLARRIQAICPNLNSRILDSAVVNVPAHVVDDAVSRIDDRDVVISVGGASAVGLAGAIGCRKNIPHICIPTTYSGSEMMPLLLDACPARHSTTTQSTGQNISHSSSHSVSRSEKPHRRHRERGPSSRSSRKGSRTTSFRDPRVLPSVIIYDEDLTTSIPRRLSAPSNETAMARSVEIREQDGTFQWSYIQLPGV